MKYFVFIFSVDSLMGCCSTLASLSLFIDGSTFTYKLNLPTPTFIHDRNPVLPAHKPDRSNWTSHLFENMAHEAKYHYVFKYLYMHFLSCEYHNCKCMSATDSSITWLRTWALDSDCRFLILDSLFCRYMSFLNLCVWMIIIVLILQRCDDSVSQFMWNT